MKESKQEKKSRKRSRSLRERQKDLTRATILQALSEVLIRDGVHGFSVQSVADQAGISHRTVYRHFPSREALLEGLTAEIDRLSEEAGLASVPRSLPHFQEAVYQAFEFFGEKKEIFQPLLIASLATGFRSSDSTGRDEAIRQIVNDQFPDLTEQERKEATAAIRMIGSSSAWLIFTTHMKLTSGEAASAVSYIISLLEKDLARKNKRAKKSREQG